MLRKFCLACKAMTVFYNGTFIFSDRELELMTFFFCLAFSLVVDGDYSRISFFCPESWVEDGSEDISFYFSVCPTRLIQSRVINYLLKERKVYPYIMNLSLWPTHKADT